MKRQLVEVEPDVLERGILEPSLVAFNHGRREDRHSMRRELADVIRHANQHARTKQMLAALDKELPETLKPETVSKRIFDLDKQVRVQQHEIVRHFLRNLDLFLLELCAF